MFLDLGIELDIIILDCFFFCGEVDFEFILELVELKFKDLVSFKFKFDEDLFDWIGLLVSILILIGLLGGIGGEEGLVWGVGLDFDDVFCFFIFL